MASREWKGLNHARRQYAEVVAPRSGGCAKSDWSDAETVKLYSSFFEPSTCLTAADQVFLGGLPEPRQNEAKSVSKEEHEPICQPTRFAQKAARLGIKCTPYTDMALGLTKHRQGLTPAGFEQINDDMFSRKDNAFMVFNRAGVESWENNPEPTSLPSERFLFGVFGEDGKQ